MDILIDEEIINASKIIDKNLERLTENNRGEISTNILNAVRKLNDNIAYKIWKDKFPNQKMGINKVASKFTSVSGCQFIADFDKCMRKSLSHFTPSEEGAVFLLSKYYKYIYHLKQVMKDVYDIDILKNVDLYFENKQDERTLDYYTQIANAINSVKDTKSDMDIYYISSSKPFRIDNKVYFEVILEPAEESPNKFNRITAYTLFDIDTNYAVSLQFENIIINILDTNFPIKIITKWEISIRPCEIINFADLIGLKINVQRSYPEYKELMRILTEKNINLLDIVELDNSSYISIKNHFKSLTKNNQSRIFDILDYCKDVILCKKEGHNIFRYLLSIMNNRIIKWQKQEYNGKNYANCNISSKCMPFDEMPFTFNPKKHKANFYTLLDCIDLHDKAPDLFAHHIISNTETNGVIFTPISELTSYGNLDKIKDLIGQYNAKLSNCFRPKNELKLYQDNKVYLNEYALITKEILESLQDMTNNIYVNNNCFSESNINGLKDEDNIDIPLTDNYKELTLKNIYNKSQVQIIYGAAGTGKSTLINYISKLLINYKKIYLAKTNSAVENLRHRVKCYNENDLFMTVDKFISVYKKYSPNAGLIVVDECSTIENIKILNVIKKIENALIILTGDIFQIESIGFGNWFALLKDFLPSHCITELQTTYRSTNDNLKELWSEVRNMNQKENLALEDLIRCSYSSEINDSIFNRITEDEIILCLNYNGLYGLNNINKLFQLKNHNKGAEIGIWQFKIGDPILFTDSGRFSVLYNNLKGKIINIEDDVSRVKFTIQVNIKLSETEVNNCNELEFISSDETTTVISFYVDRHKPFYFDYEPENKKHVLPFQIAYAVSIHKSQGLEYNSVKIVISNETENKITHDIFYTAITRSKENLKLYWPYAVANKILSTIKPKNSNSDSLILKSLFNKDDNN